MFLDEINIKNKKKTKNKKTKNKTMEIINSILYGVSFLSIRHDHNMAYCLSGFLCLNIILNPLIDLLSHNIFRHLYHGPIDVTHRSRKKFKKQFWDLYVHSICVLYELYIINTVPDIWENFDLIKVFNSPSQPILSLNVFYMYQLATWLYTAHLHTVNPFRNKDHYQMYFHHIVTILLIIGSFMYNLQYAGLVVMFIHDFSDIFIDLMKMSNHLVLDVSTGFYLTEIFFGLNLVSWIYMRFYNFGYKVIIPIVYNILNIDTLMYQKILAICLLFLLVLNIMWFFLFLRILYSLIIEKKEATRVADEKYQN
jgi:hypothetical protein